MSTNPDESPVAGYPSYEPPVAPPVPAYEAPRAEYPGPPIPAPPAQPQIAAPQGYDQRAQLSIDKEPLAPYAPPVQQQQPPSPYGEPAYSGAQQGYQQAPQDQSPYAGYGQQQPQQGYYQNAPSAYGAQPTPAEVGRQAASNSQTMGIIAVCLAVLIGWIPFFGLLGVAGGVGLGIPALFAAKRAEENGAKATVGTALGWIAIGFSILWVMIYVFLIVVGALSDESGSSSM